MTCARRHAPSSARLRPERADARARLPAAQRSPRASWAVRSPARSRAALVCQRSDRRPARQTRGGGCPGVGVVGARRARRVAPPGASAGGVGATRRAHSGSVGPVGRYASHATPHPTSGRCTPAFPSPLGLMAKSDLCGDLFARSDVEIRPSIGLSIGTMDRFATAALLPSQPLEVRAQLASAWRSIVCDIDCMCALVAPPLTQERLAHKGRYCFPAWSANARGLQQRKTSVSAFAI